MPKLNQLFTQKGFIKLSKNTLISFLIVSTLLVGTGIIFLFNPFFGTKSAEAAWFNDNWGYRKSLTFTHNATVSTPSKVKFDVDTTAAPTDFQADCGDVRFTSPNGDILPYYYDSAGGACDTNSTDFYVLIPSIINGSNYIYIYYGNPSITDGTRSANFSESTTTPSGGAASVGSEEKAPSPTGYWKFDDGQGTTAQDSTSNNKDGTLAASTATPTWQTEDQCIEGKCLYFDGINDYASVASPNLPTGDFTYSAWVYSLDNSDDMIFMASDGATSNEFAVHLASTKVRINIDNSAVINTTNVFSMNTWNYLAVTRSGSTITVYVNGKADPTTGSSATAMNFSTCELLIGVDADSGCNGSLGNHFKGKIDEAKIYNQVLTAPQVLANYNARGNPEGVAGTLGANTQNMPDALSDGLVGYWKMDENTGTTTSDSSGNGNTSSAFTGNTTWTTGKFGTGLTFDGTNDVARIPETASTDVGGSSSSFTISSWFKTTASQAGGGGYVAAKFSAAGDVAFILNVISTNQLQFEVNGGTDYIAATTMTVNDGLWHHFVGVRDISGLKMHLYLDGVLKDTIAITAQDATNNDDISIGNGSTSYTGADFNGQIDESRLYSRALSPAEVSQLYNWAPGPVGYWKMDEGSWTNNCSTDSVFDSSGNSNNGDACPNSTGPAGGAIGKYGKAGDFDGSNDYVNIVNSTSLQNIRYTHSFWMYADNAADTGAYEDVIGSNDAGQISVNYGFQWRNSNGASWIKTCMQKGGAGPYELAQISSTMNTGTWYHVACSYDGTRLKAYLNGRLEASVAATDPYTDNQIQFAADGLGSNNFNGKVDDIKIYNYARSQAQVIEDMNAGHPAPGSPVSSAVAHWKLDEGYGTSAQDYSGQANTLTLNTATSAWTNIGKFNKAWVGLGTNWLSKADDADFDFSATDDGSISMWFKSTSASNPGATEYLLSKGPGATLAGYSIYANTSGFICYGVDDDTTFGPDDSACTTTDIYDATWHHIVAVKTATSRIDLYVDGRPTASDTSIAATGSLANSTTLYVGDFNGTDNGNEFNGTLDEIKVYRSALTADQVKIDMNRSSSQVMGATSASSNSQPNSAANEYCPSDSATAVCTGPVGEWKLDEGSGLIANDSSGNANTADIVAGNGSYINSKFNKGYSFDALSTHIFAGSGSTLDNLGASGGMTFEAWIFPKSRGENNNAFIAAKNAGNSQATGGWLFLINGISGNQAGLEFVVDGSTDLVRDTAATTITLNQWNHVAVSWDGVMTTASTARIFVNGKEATYTGTTNGATRPDDGASSLYIGNASSTDRTFDGIIDQVKVFNYNRSQAQIAWSYNKGGPIAHWKMDECQGTTINDMSGNSYTGTLTNATAGTCQTSGSWFNGVSGKRNYSMSFDGTNDYITASDTSLPTGSNPRSISAWIKTSSSTNQHILTYGNSAFANNQIYLAIYNLTGSNCSNAGTNSTYALVLGSGVDPNNICDNKSLVDGGWHHVVGVVNGSTITLYVDGVQRITSATLTVNTALAGVLRIGSTLSGTIPFNGQIDDTRVYNYPLTPTQVKTLYNDGATRYGPTTGAP